MPLCTPEQLRDMMRSVPEFPVPGILFRDITPLLSDTAALRSLVVAMAKLAPQDYTHIASIEARGFILGGALAQHLGKGFVPVRKPGKLPADTISEEYGLEYGKGTLELHSDAVPPGSRIWVIDDLLATGGTLAAACKLVERIGGEIAGVSVLVELEGLNGWDVLPGYGHSSVFTMSAN